MTDHPKNLTYDWDAHFGIQADLRALDDFHLQMLGKRPLQPGNVKKHIFPEFNALVGDQYVDMNEYLMRLAKPVRELLEKVEKFAVMSGARSCAIVSYLDGLVDLFPEERWKSFISYEIYNKGKTLKDIEESLDAIRPIYAATSGRSYYTYASWQGAERDIGYAYNYLKDIEARRPVPDIPPNEVMLEKRSFCLAEMQEQFAAKTLEYASLQAAIVRDSLRLATTMSVLPPRFKAPFRERIAICADMASLLMVTADFALDDAADLRNASHGSRDLRRPIF